MELFVTDNTRDDKVFRLSDLYAGTYLAEVGGSRIECFLIVYSGCATGFAIGDTSDLRRWSNLVGECQSDDWRTTELRKVRKVEVDTLDVTVTKHL